MSYISSDRSKRPVEPFVWFFWLMEFVFSCFFWNAFMLRLQKGVKQTTRQWNGLFSRILSGFVKYNIGFSDMCRTQAIFPETATNQNYIWKGPERCWLLKYSRDGHRCGVTRTALWTWIQKKLARGWELGVTATVWHLKITTTLKSSWCQFAVLDWIPRPYEYWIIGGISVTHSTRARQTRECITHCRKSASSPGSNLRDCVDPPGHLPTICDRLIFVTDIGNPPKWDDLGYEYRNRHEDVGGGSLPRSFRHSLQPCPPTADACPGASKQDNQFNVQMDNVSCIGEVRCSSCKLVPINDSHSWILLRP
jgi:hypothetical protein